MVHLGLIFLGWYDWIYKVGDVLTLQTLQKQGFAEKSVYMFVY